MEQTVLSGFDRAIDFIVPNCPKEAKAQIKNLVKCGYCKNSKLLI